MPIEAVEVPPGVSVIDELGVNEVEMPDVPGEIDVVRITGPE